MAMGLILGGNRVSVLLVHNGVWNLLPLQAEKIGRPSIQTYLEYFPKVQVDLYAEAESVAARKGVTLPDQVKTVSKKEAFSLISEADIVIPFR